MKRRGFIGFLAGAATLPFVKARARDDIPKIRETRGFEFIEDHRLRWKSFRDKKIFPQKGDKRSYLKPLTGEVVGSVGLLGNEESLCTGEEVWNGRDWVRIS